MNHSLLPIILYGGMVMSTLGQINFESDVLPTSAGTPTMTFIGDKRVYVAGDTENTPEMQALRGVDVAFLPMNLPYTMTPEMVAAAAKVFRPKILYPYHYGDTDPARLTALLKNLPGIEVRIRGMR